MAYNIKNTNITNLSVVRAIAKGRSVRLFVQPSMPTRFKVTKYFHTYYRTIYLSIYIKIERCRCV